MKRVVVGLQSRGVRIDVDYGKKTLSRRGGAGPANGIFLALDDGSGRVINVPLRSWYTKFSPYYLKEHNGGLCLMRGREFVTSVKLRESSSLHTTHLSSRERFDRIALIHGMDCLASTVIQSCQYKGLGKGCAFCGIDLTLKKGKTARKKDPEALAEAAALGVERGEISHVTLTTGSTIERKGELVYLSKCVMAIKKRAPNLPIHVQVLPPSDLGLLRMLRESGVDNLGIHIESFNLEVLKRYAPPKYEIGMPFFKQAWERAVSIWGPNQVESFLIVGLGETVEEVLGGARFLTEIGVFPYIVPLRPIPGTPLEKLAPPDEKVMERIYNETAELLDLRGMSSRRAIAGCVRCGACSALMEFEG